MIMLLNTLELNMKYVMRRRFRALSLEKNIVSCTVILSISTLQGILVS